MISEVLSIVLSCVAAVAAVAGVWLSVRHNRQRAREREEDRRLLEEQLALARDQSEMRPRLWVTEIRLLDTRDSDALEGSVDPPWLDRLRNAWDVGPLAAVSTFLQQRRLLDKTFVERVVLVTLGNEGKTAAHLLTGWLYLDASQLEPTKPSGGYAVSREGDEYRVDVVGEGGPRCRHAAPSPSEC